MIRLLVLYWKHCYETGIPKNKIKCKEEQECEKRKINQLKLVSKMQLLL